MARVENRPNPPGEYPVVVVGSGPGGLQTSYALGRLGIAHAAITADDSPGGMFRKWPIFQRLLSWTKPDAPYERGTREYEWYDHNSLVADEPSYGALVAAEIDRSFMVPSQPEMERSLAAFARTCGLRVRYGCTWEATRLEEDGFVLETSDGEYRCRGIVFAVGVTEPWKSPIPGIDFVPHYAETKGKREYQGKRVFVIGKRNSAFEIADALAPWARQVILGSPRPVQSAVLAAATVRVRYFQPLEDASWGGGTLALNAAIERIERTDAGYRVFAKGTTRSGDLVLEADEMIAATGFTTPLRDLPDLGVATVSQGRIPALTPFWESVSVPGIFFAGNAMQGAAGLRRHGIGSASGTVAGFRYNARILARHIAENHLGLRTERPQLEPAEIAPHLAAELTRAPELWTQKSYLARVVTLNPPEGPRDEGFVPLAHFVDSGGPDAIAATVEANAAGEIYPALFVRRGGSVHERLLEPNDLHHFERGDYLREIEALL